LGFTIFSRVELAFRPVVFSVSPKTAKASFAPDHDRLEKISPPCEIRRDAGFDRRGACSTRLNFSKLCGFIIS
jgi:hypothetical protein